MLTSIQQSRQSRSELKVRKPQGRMDVSAQVSAAGNVWFSRVNQTKETKTPVREEFHPELRSEKLKCTSIAAA